MFQENKNLLLDTKSHKETESYYPFLGGEECFKNSIASLDLDKANGEGQRLGIVRNSCKGGGKHGAQC